MAEWNISGNISVLRSFGAPIRSKSGIHRFASEIRTSRSNVKVELIPSIKYMNYWVRQTKLAFLFMDTFPVYMQRDDPLPLLKQVSFSQEKLVSTGLTGLVADLGWYLPEKDRCRFWFNGAGLVADNIGFRAVACNFASWNLRAGQLIAQHATVCAKTSAAPHAELF